MSRTQRDRRATEGEILEAVGTLLTREGFASLGVNAVAREAGVDKVLIYRYFDGMPGVLHAFAESEALWPGIDEILGGGPTDLRTMDVADRWATALVRYLRALQRRPLAREVLAWEQVDRNELTENLQQRRDAWFDDLLALLSDDGASVSGLDPVATVLVAATAIHYLLARSRLHASFNELDIDSEDGWSRIEEIVHTMARCAIEAHVRGATAGREPTDPTPRKNRQERKREMTRLSERLKLLADHAAAIEERAEAARDEAIERRDEKVAEARARLQRQQDAFSAQVTAMSHEAQAAWTGVRDSLKRAGDSMRSRAEKGLHAIELKDAEISATLAEADAIDAIEFALLAVAEADAAVMESIAAAARVDALAAR